MRLLVAVVVIAIGGLFPVPVDAQTIRLKNGNTLYGVGGAEATQPQTTSPPSSKESQVSSPPMVSVVRLTNGSVLQGKVLRKDGEKVTLELPDVGQMTFATSEITSIEDVPADAISKLAAQETEATEGLVYVNGQWTTPRATQPLRSQPHYPQQIGYYHHYPATEKGLAEAQRALNRATKSEEIQQLHETIQRLRTDLAEQKEGQRKEKEEMATKQQEYVERQSKAQVGKSKQPKTSLEEANEEVKKEMEASRVPDGESVRFKQCASSYDPITGQKMATNCY